jgi:hypothetical protein
MTLAEKIDEKTAGKPMSNQETRLTRIEILTEMVIAQRLEDRERFEIERKENKERFERIETRLTSLERGVDKLSVKFTMSAAFLTGIITLATAFLKFYK